MRTPLAAFCFLVLALVLALPHPASAEPGRTFLLRLGPGTEELAPRFEGYRFERDSPDRIVVEVEGQAREASGAATPPAAVIRVELLPARPALRDALGGLPIELADGAVRFAGTSYEQPDLLVVVRLPDAEVPTWIVAGRDPREVGFLIYETLWGASGRRPSFDYVLRGNRWTQRSGHWRATADGVLPGTGERDDFAERAAALDALVPIVRPNVVVRVAPERRQDPEITALADALDEAAARMAPRVPVRLESPLEVIAESDYAALGRRFGELDESLLDEAGRLHLVVHPDDGFAYRYGLARALVRRGGLALPTWIEDGAALFLSQDWYGRPYAEWLPDLARAGVFPEPDELLATSRQRGSSEVLWPPVAAAILEGLAGATLRDKLPQPPGRPAVQVLLQRVRTTLRPSTAQAPASPAELAFFLNGISLAMPPGQIDGGYHAPAIDTKLRRLRQMGANSVAVIPLALKRQPDDPDLFFAVRNPTDETDAGLVHAARRAHAHGFQVLWKPHVYVGGGSWPGEIAMRSDEDWRAWWRSYRRYIVHHAVLARWTGAELFAVGTELGKTIDHEVEWRGLIRAVRQVYGGPLTYAGNWWGDYDRVPFWDALDLIGVDAYFPLAEKPDATRDELAAGARRVVAQLAAVSERFGKPILLTELGYAAQEGAWVAPHVEGGIYSAEHQALAYEVFLEALGRPAWLRGLYLWKVFSTPGTAAGVEWANFQLLGRPAEAVVETYFTTAE